MMSKGWVTAYRLIGIVVSLFSYLFLFAGIAGLLKIGLDGIVLLVLFISASMVIYSILTNMFSRLVLMLGQPMRHALKDWIKVNTYVTLIFCGLCLISGLPLLFVPGQIALMLQQYPPDIRPSADQMRSLVEGLMVFAVLGFIHTIWTLRLVRRYHSVFK
jgi:hypothetical protein